jgi:hypothetical protein
MLRMYADADVASDNEVDIVELNQLAIYNINLISPLGYCTGSWPLLQLHLVTFAC